MTIEVVIAEPNREFNNHLSSIIKKDHKTELIGRSYTGLETISLVMRYRPKILILGINLPDLDVISVIKRVMRQFPTPILIIYEKNDAETVMKIKQLEIGLIDFLQSTRRGPNRFVSDISLTTRIQILAKLNVERFGMQIRQGIKQTRSRKKSRINRSPKRNKNRSTSRKVRKNRSRTTTRSYSGSGRNSRIVIIGTSTGGPRLLSEIVPEFPKNMPPIIIIQHMPVGFISAFSRRLDRLAKIDVHTAESGEAVLPGNVYLAPGGKHLEFHQANRNTPQILLTDGPLVNFVKPAVDVTLKSATKVYGSGVISVILTGMGSDGLDGSRTVKETGGKVLALNKEDSDIYGMNRAVIENGLTDQISGKNELVLNIIRLLERRG